MIPKTLFTLLFFSIALTSYAADLYPPENEMSRAQKVLYKSVPLQAVDSNKGLEKLTGLPSGAGNAAENYSKLEELFKEDQREKGYYSIKKRSKGVNEILKAVGKKECKFAPEYYPYMNAGTVKQPDIIIFLTYMNGLFDLAEELEEKGDFKGADAIYRSALIFGWHLTQYPPTIVTELLGVTIKRSAAEKYSGFLLRKMDMKRSDLALAYQEYLEEVGFIFNRFQNFFLGSVANFNSLFSTIKIATDAEDLIWRQQAILVLGLYRHGIVNRDGVILGRDPKMQKFAENALVYITENGKTQTEQELAAWTIKKLTPEVFAKINEKMQLSPNDLGRK